jgi:hypothetical protein
MSMTQFRETATNGVKVILLRALHLETSKEIKMQGAMIHSDRGCNNNKILCFCNKVHLSVFFTVKHGPTLPFVFGATNYKRSRKQQVFPKNYFHMS